MHHHSNGCVGAVQLWLVFVNIHGGPSSACGLSCLGIRAANGWPACCHSYPRSIRVLLQADAVCSALVLGMSLVICHFEVWLVST